MNTNIESHSENTTTSVSHSRTSSGLLRFFLMSVIFCSGFIVGVAATFSYIHHKIFLFQTDPESVSSRMMKHFHRHYDLTPEQEAKVELIVSDHLEEMRDLNQKVRPRIHRQMREFREEIGMVLTERQRKVWERNFDRIRRFVRPHDPFRRRRGRDFDDR